MPTHDEMSKYSFDDVVNELHMLGLNEFGNIIQSHTTLMQQRIDELEALSKQAHIAQLTSAEEWESLTPQSRHRLNAWIMDAEKLGGLVLTMLSHYSHPMLPSALRDEVERLALELAPKPETQVYSLENSPAQTGEPGQARFVKDHD